MEYWKDPNECVTAVVRLFEDCRERSRTERRAPEGQSAHTLRLHRIWPRLLHLGGLPQWQLQGQSR